VCVCVCTGFINCYTCTELCRSVKGSIVNSGLHSQMQLPGAKACYVSRSYFENS